MKKLLSLILVVSMLAVALVGCAGESEKNDAFPTLTYLYNTNDGHKAIGEYLQAALANVGITMNLENQEWNTFLNTRKEGKYSIARNGWLADYNDPICFLDMWTSGSGNNDVQFGKGDHANLKMYNLDLTKWGYETKVENGTWAETYDVLISTIKSCTDTEKRYEMMHLAEDILMETGCIVPLYYYTDLYMIDDSVEGFFSNPLGYKYFMYTTVDGKSEVIDVCLASEPDTLDPALNSAVDGATMISHLFSGLAKWAEDEDGNLVIVPDCATELPAGVANENGTVTYTYTLKDGLKWSNGDDLVAKDFADSWQRAASADLAADYGYMFEVVEGYGTDKLAVEAVDDKTLKVTLANDVAYWNELLAFPTYFPVHADSMKNESWATKPETYICNGAYTIDAWTHDSVITLKKNPTYHDATAVKMEKINCYLSDEANTMLANFKKGDWLLIDDVPTNEIATLKKDYPEEFVIAGQIGTYYVCWNINEKILPESSELTGVEAEKAQAEIRRAIALLFDRNYIVESVAQGGQLPASSFVAMGMTNPDGTEFYKTANSTTDAFDGYYNVSKEAHQSNVDSAIEVLEKYYDLEK
ncbi:MAG: peptide ABC transporter substrate-binding protein [Ruminococcaceae bacterium]|nr:peptide ABC transporter substrate-binding protein [Oscillospiraceae bacterium]